MAASGHAHDEPVGVGDAPPSLRVIHDASRQAQRARRAETARQRQRAALLNLIARAMADLHISLAELNAARRTLMSRVSPPARDEKDSI